MTSGSPIRDSETDWLDPKRYKIGLKSILWRATGRPAQTPYRFLMSLMDGYFITGLAMNPTMTRTTPATNVTIPGTG